MKSWLWGTTVPFSPLIVPARRGRGAAARLDQYYGTGLGQVPLHLAPEDAVLDTSGNVVSVPNRGGAGAGFNATASASGITRSGNLLIVPERNSYLTLTNSADMIGVRLFMAIALAAGASGLYTLAGRNNSSAVGERVNIQYDTALNMVRVGRQGSGAIELPTGAALGSDLRIFEVEFGASVAQLRINGLLQSSASHAWPTLLVNRIFGGQATPFFYGTSGDIVFMVTDGSAAMDLRAAEIRSILAAKHGITLK